MARSPPHRTGRSRARHLAVRNLCRRLAGRDLSRLARPACRATADAPLPYWPEASLRWHLAGDGRAGDARGRRHAACYSPHLSYPQRRRQGAGRARRVLSAVIAGLAARMFLVRLLRIHLDCGEASDPCSQVVREHKSAATALDGAQLARLDRFIEGRPEKSSLDTSQLRFAGSGMPFWNRWRRRSCGETPRMKR
jgi:hypothetical protein